MPAHRTSTSLILRPKRPLLPLVFFQLGHQLCFLALAGGTIDEAATPEAVVDPADGGADRDNADDLQQQATRDHDHEDAEDPEHNCGERSEEHTSELQSHSFISYA